MTSSDHDLVAPLLTEPLWRPEHLGAPIPDSPHAVSVCLPTWADNVGYEEGERRVLDRLRAGYPRFVYHPICRELFEECRRRFARGDESCLAFPTAASAERLADWIRRRANAPARIVPVDNHVHATFFDPQHAAEARSFWQHTGEGVSSRLAEATLASLRGASRPGIDRGATDRSTGVGDPHDRLRARIAKLAGVAPRDVYLFPCGMNAAWQIARALVRLFPGRRSAQFGFPYVDTLKVQEKLGAGAAFLPRGDAHDLASLRPLLESERLLALFTELPSNPLLISPDLEALSRLARRHEVPLVVDDTVASCLNVDALPVADVLWMSLTKYFSGVGDVTGGAAIVNPRSPFAADLQSAMAAEFENLLDEQDAAVLERNSRGFEPRMARISANAERLAEFLRGHPRVARVHFPKFTTPALYNAFRRRGGGYGGLLSVELRDAPSAAPRFHDALRVCKGPNLGMAYTLACPYTILAHYTELDFAERCGVSSRLIRISAGIEDPADLEARFDEALR